MTAVTCAAGVDRLMDYFDGALSTAARAQIDAHVAGCPRCAAFVASYSATPAIFRQATTATLPVTRQAALLMFLRTRRGD